MNLQQVIKKKRKENKIKHNEQGSTLSLNNNLAVNASSRFPSKLEKSLGVSTTIINDMSEHGMQMLEKILVIQSGKVAQKVTTANKN